MASSCDRAGFAITSEARRVFCPPGICPAALCLAILLALCVGWAHGQPVETGRSFRRADLVELIDLDSTLRLDVRYASSDNFMGRPMYTQARAFLQRPAAKALIRAHRKLRMKGYGIVIFDAYRPWNVTKRFWDETPPQKRKYVANPAKGSRHNRGCAVDVTLYDLRSGEEVPMPTGYDDFTERAAAGYQGGTDEQRRMRSILRAALEAEGFAVNPDEWWHFDFREWRRYRVLNIPFEKLN